ncbi:MAG: CoB--CoM heterodisulfide reductase iron-sulfur subunit B family protein [bacterium]|nr:CoB--CoM heterodisulfide reductase iron-sulfur subunit B family protein [bacterium]
MKYLYYPGCSLKVTGKPYEDSLLAVFNALEEEIEEVNDWNCCGATAYSAVDQMKAFALAARNLALAEEQGGEKAELVAPCAACYLVLNKTCHSIQDYPARVGLQVKRALKAGNLTYKGTVNIRHPLDVFANDIGLEVIEKRVKNKLAGLKVACYYGCQIVRPYAEFDDQHQPMTMDNIIKALGAEPVNWSLKTRCCGGSLSATVSDDALSLSRILIKEAKRRGADIITTACSLCQFNLECFQEKLKQKGDQPGETEIPVAYFTQIMGKALGIDEAKLGFKQSFMPLETLF